MFPLRDICVESGFFYVKCSLYIATTGFLYIMLRQSNKGVMVDNFMWGFERKIFKTNAINAPNIQACLKNLSNMEKCLLILQIFAKRSLWFAGYLLRHTYVIFIYILNHEKNTPIYKKYTKKRLSSFSAIMALFSCNDHKPRITHHNFRKPICKP